MGIPMRICFGAEKRAGQAMSMQNDQNSRLETLTHVRRQFFRCFTARSFLDDKDMETHQHAAKRHNLNGATATGRFVE